MRGNGTFCECGVYDFCKESRQRKRIPFEVSVDPFYSESNIRYLEQKMEDFKAERLHFSEHELLETEE